MIYGCVCSKCKRWHSHICKKGKKYVCVNCFHKRREVEDGKGED